jgi:predicted HicB family RNase H-like nuclease
LAQAKRTRKPGRPKLPKGEAMGRIVPVRFTGEALRAMEAKAKATQQTLSEWIRSTLNAALS